MERLRGSSRFVDVSHVVEDGMITYPGLPAPLICDYLSRAASHERYAAGTEFQIGKIEMVGNTGTYVDAPFHRYPDGKDLSALPLESLANLDCVVARIAPGGPATIDTLPLGDRDLRGRAVLIQTGWDQHWRTDAYLSGHPHLSERLAERLARAGVALVGIDSLNIDGTSNGERPVHTVLLGHDIPIVEHMRGLAAVPEQGSRFFAVPAKVKAFGSFPVRAFVIA